LEFFITSLFVVFEDKSCRNTKSFFSEILASLSDAKFSQDGTYIVARDFLNIKIWDIRQTDKPVQTIPVFENLKPSLTLLYEKDYIFDKFECSFNGTGSQIMTGSYNNYLHLYDVLTGDRFVSLLADKSIFLQKRPAVDYSCMTKTPSKPLTPSLTSSTSKLSILRKKSKEPNPPLDPNSLLSSIHKDKANTTHLVNPDNLDPTKKILYASWHPRENTMAVAAQNNLFIFYESATPKN
jgi:serine/threonine-protein phosphatase 2A regulatory subunit B